MIRRSFREPNFRCAVTDENGVRSVWLTSGESDEEVEQRLTSRELTVHWVREYDFRRWAERARELSDAVREAHERGVRLTFEDGHWKQLKLHLFELFDGKCAYCEASTREVASGDVEHFRPKRGVKDDPTHPGYYWLAYDTSNLLPACERCNRAGAKMNHFPVEDGSRARRAEEVGDERPLLLNPYGDDEPLDHLRFLRTGQVEGRTAKGKRSVEVYHLGRYELREARYAHLGFLDNEINSLIGTRGLGLVVGELIREVSAGTRAYSAAQLAHLSRRLEEEQRQLAAALELLPQELQAPHE